MISKTLSLIICLFFGAQIVSANEDAKKCASVPITRVTQFVAYQAKLGDQIGGKAQRAIQSGIRKFQTDNCPRIDGSSYSLNSYSSGAEQNCLSYCNSNHDNADNCKHYCSSFLDSQAIYFWGYGDGKKDCSLSIHTGGGSAQGAR